MKTLFAALFTVVLAVSQAQAADVQSTPAAPQWFHLESGWYLMTPAGAPQVATTNGNEFAAPKVLPAGVTPAGAPIVAITAPTIRIQRAESEVADFAVSSGGSIWDSTPTGNNSTSGSLGSMR